MTDTYKPLAQNYPTAATLTDMYTVPGATQTVVASVFVCNQSAVADSFRISVAVAGAADSPEQYLYYNVPIRGNATFVATVGITMSTTDVLRIRSTNGTCSFNATGVQVT